MPITISQASSASRNFGEIEIERTSSRYQVSRKKAMALSASTTLSRNAQQRRPRIIQRTTQMTLPT